MEETEETLGTSSLVAARGQAQALFEVAARAEVDVDHLQAALEDSDLWQVLLDLAALLTASAHRRRPKARRARGRGARAPRGGRFLAAAPRREWGTGPSALLSALTCCQGRRRDDEDVGGVGPWWRGPFKG